MEVAPACMTGAGRGGVAEIEAGFESHWVASGRSESIGYITKFLLEWSAAGIGRGEVWWSEAFGHG